MAASSHFQLVENSLDLIQTLDATGRFLYVNTAWQRLLGYSTQEAQRLAVLDLVSPREASHCAELFGRLVSGKSLGLIQTEFQSKDCRAIAVEGHCVMRFLHGKPIYGLGIFRDVTAHDLRDAQRQQVAEELAYSVASIQALAKLLPMCEACLQLGESGALVTIESHRFCVACTERLGLQPTVIARGA